MSEAKRDDRHIHPIGSIRDLWHNANVCLADVLYASTNGTSFYNEEVSISDKRGHVTLIAKEAISLLAWLQEHKEHLEELAKREG